VIDDAPFCLVLLAGVSITGSSVLHSLDRNVTRLIGAADNMEKVELASESLA